MKKNQINKNRIKKKISSMSKVSNDNNLMKNEETYLELKDNVNKNNKEKKEPYPPDVSEIIAKILIEKIIAISIRDAKKEEIQPILLNYYSEYVTNQINTLLSLNYLFHIEEPENFDTFDYSKFWNTNYKKSNTKKFGGSMLVNMQRIDEKKPSYSKKDNKRILSWKK